MNTLIHPNPALYLSPEMVTELALGSDPPLEVAARYGLTVQDFAKLQAQEWFGEMVVKRRNELHEDGQTFAAKAKMMAEELFLKLFQNAVSGNLAHPLMLDMAKQLTDIGGLRPQKGDPGGSGGPAFQITINVPADAARPGQRVIEGEAKAVPTVSIPLDPLPPKPEGFRVPDFKLTPDLVGSPVAVQAATEVKAF